MGKNGNIHPKRIFKTPKELEQRFNEYKADLKEKESEWLKVQYVGRDGQRVTDSTKLPLTLEGFKRYCYDIGLGDISEYFNQRKGDYYNDFSNIVMRVRNEIRENQIMGGMNGFYNQNLTARLNGLTDKQEIDTTLNVDKVPSWMKPKE